MNGDNSSTSVIQAKDSSTASDGTASGGTASGGTASGGAAADGTASGGAAFDAAAFRRAIEERDTATLLALYADDAELVVVDRDAQPSRPRVLTGVGEIGAYLDDLCGRDMTHTIDRLVHDGEGAAYLETCAYPDGLKVRCAAVLDLRGGRIARQSGVQAWDE